MELTEIIKWAFTVGIVLAFNYGMIFISMRSARSADSKTMIELQTLADAAVEAQKKAIAARDEAVAALEEYKRMRVADFEIVIVFSLHPSPQVKDVSIRSLPDGKHNEDGLPVVALVEDRSITKKIKGLARK
jgi:hypothetical protein